MGFPLTVNTGNHNYSLESCVYIGVKCLQAPKNMIFIYIGQNKDLIHENHAHTLMFVQELPVQSYVCCAIPQ